MPTILDLARRAGVSVTTASRALNGYNDVNAETRRRVMAVADELGYYPSAAAQGLRSRRTNTIAYAPHLHGHREAEPFFQEFIGVLARSCYKHNLSLLAMVAEGAADDHDAIYRELIGTRRVDGLILADVAPADPRLALLQAHNLPFVAFGRTAQHPAQQGAFVDVDGAAGMRAVLDHLVGAGHRRIAYLGGPPDTFYALDRYSGYHAGLVAHDLPLDPRLVIRDVQEREQVQEAVAAWLALPPAAAPTAIMTSADRLALNVLYMLEEWGPGAGRKPGQIAVTGFDDLPFATYLRPALTTVRQPMAAICDTLIDLLVAQLYSPSPPASNGSDGATLVPQQVLLAPELIRRDSA